MGKRKELSFDFGFRFLKGFPGGELTNAVIMVNAIGDLKEHRRPVDVGHQFVGCSSIAGSFSVGEYAVNFGGLPTVRQDRGWYETTGFMKAFYGLCAESRVETGDELDLTVVIPIDDSEMSSVIKRTLLGAHWFTLRGQEHVIFSVSSVTVIQQGIASLFHFLFNLNGELALRDEAGKLVDINDKQFYILEVGGQTLHEVWFRGLSDVKEATLTNYDWGYWKVISLVDQYLREEHKAKKSKLEVAKATEEKRIFCGREIDLTDLVNDLESQLAQKHIDLISGRALDNADYVLVAGGTGARLFEHYRAWYPRFELIPNPRISNVVGGYKARQAMKE